MNRPPAPPRAAIDPARAGLAYGLLAYGLWGVLPIYFKALAAVSPLDIVAHRILWSLLFLVALLAVTNAWGQVRTGLSHRRTMAILGITALLIGANWLLYVYAVTSGQILAASLGYYLNPLMNILLGRFILKERLTVLQWAAVAIAAAGVSVLAAGAGTTLWISLALCVSFATYGLLRKIVAVDALAGLTIETAILFPVALGWLAFGFSVGTAVMGSTPVETWLLILSGIVSTTPLLLFTAAARRLRYSTLGMLQFAAPTMQFLLAVALYGEAFTRAHAIAFAAIWAALALYVTSLVRDLRAQRRHAAAPDLCEP
jgi:chloramphenicol-sensitive protein RarD